jgi:hypothetical protein
VDAILLNDEIPMVAHRVRLDKGCGWNLAVRRRAHWDSATVAWPGTTALSPVACRLQHMSILSVLYVFPICLQCACIERGPVLAR